MNEPKINVKKIPVENTKANLDFSLVLASSVHDMKNSVGMLLASLEQVIEATPPENPEQSKRFSTLHYEASRINGELVQLLTIYRMQNNFLPLHIDDHYVIDVLEDQIARNHTLIETGHIKMDLDCDPDLSWCFDSDLIGSVIHNIIVNCSRYTKSEIYIGAKVEDDLLVITVADDGHGYPKHMLDKPSAMIESAELSKNATHLGLYLAENIAKMHKQNNRHGFIRLENGAPLGGGAFKVFLP